jgi:hypothetical protein
MIPGPCLSDLSQIPLRADEREPSAFPPPPLFHFAFLSLYVKTSLFISLCILRDLPQQKIPRELLQRGRSCYILCSHVPMERFFDGTDQENSKTQGGKGEIRKIQKNKNERSG